MTVSASFAAKSGAARAAILSPTGAMATSVSAAARAMMMVLEGTPCAPMALRTIWSTVAIFTNAVTVMNANGRSDTTASATTRTIGRESRSSTPSRPPAAVTCCCLALEGAGEHVGEGRARSGQALPGHSELTGGELAELGEAAFADADDEHLGAHPDEVDRAARVERQVPAELDRAARPPDAQPARTPEHDERQRAHRGEGDEGLDEVPLPTARCAAPLYRD